jgi:16S rRNA U516 pseudouridylate synthase RsuA-like enzyme
MDESKFNMSLRKFLKEVGVTSQREIERLVRESGLDKAGHPGPLKVKAVITADGTGLHHVVQGDIALD